MIFTLLKSKQENRSGSVAHVVEIFVILVSIDRIMGRPNALLLVLDELKLPDDVGDIPKSQGRGWWFESRP
jgi:hypothetical protein